MISTLPTAPSRSMTPDAFVVAADAFVAALPNFCAELNAMGTLYNLATTTTSSTSVLIGTGSKSFTVGTNLGYAVGMAISIASTASPANNMFGTVTSYNSGTGALVVNVTTVNGSGTLAAWTISLAASSSGASLSTNTFTGVQNDAMGADIASAATVNLTTATGNTVQITGSVNITAVTLGSGMTRGVIFTGAPLLTFHATNLNLNSNGQNVQIQAGDRGFFWSNGSVVYGMIIPADGRALNGYSKIQPITASVATNALTVTLNPTTLDFRSAALNSGTVNTRTVAAAISLTVSSGSTLGTVNATAARLAILAIDNAGTVELAVVNLAGGNQLDETNLISTTAEGGAGAADSNNVIYSTTARTSVAYRVVGFIDITEATAGTWATAPSTIQGCGGQALSALSSLGYGQSWQSVTRTAGTTYYNTTGKPIQVLRYISNPSNNCSSQVSINGGANFYIAIVAVGGGTTATGVGTVIIPPSASYVFTDVAATSMTTQELR